MEGSGSVSQLDDTAVPCRARSRYSSKVQERKQRPQPQQKRTERDIACGLLALHPETRDVQMQLDVNGCSISSSCCLAATARRDSCWTAGDDDSDEASEAAYIKW